MGEQQLQQKPRQQAAVAPAPKDKNALASLETTRTLSQGMSGPEVSALQRALKSLGYNCPQDGKFSTKTKEAVQLFQRDNELSHDGIAGPKTIKAIRAGLNDQMAARPTLNLPPRKEQTAEITSAVVPSETPPKDSRIFVQQGYDDGVRKPFYAQTVGRFILDYRAAGALVEMQSASNVDLDLTSAFRTYQKQMELFEKYGPRRAARPGFSNHQMGIAVDVAMEGYPNAEKCRQTPQYRWLAANARRFGFANTVAHEPWHWEYRPEVCGLADASNRKR